VQLWQTIAQGLGDPEVVIMVSRIDAPCLASGFVGRPQHESPAVITGIAVHSLAREARSWRTDSSLWAAGEVMLAGRVGDCCDEHHESHSPPGLSGQRASSFGGRRQGDKTESWGVVVRCKDGQSLEGCYVLTTVRGSDSECTCTHYSLVKLSLGAGSVQQQVSAAWMA
jgi:hypothetical protein